MFRYTANFLSTLWHYYETYCNQLGRYWIKNYKLKNELSVKPGTDVYQFPDFEVDVKGLDNGTGVGVREQDVGVTLKIFIIFLRHSEETKDLKPKNASLPNDSLVLGFSHLIQEQEAVAMAICLTSQRPLIHVSFRSSRQDS